MCVYLGYIARPLEMLQHMFYMASVSDDTQLSSVPEVLYCHPARVVGYTSHGTALCPLELLQALGVVLIHYRLQMPP